MAKTERRHLSSGARTIDSVALAKEVNLVAVKASWQHASEAGCNYSMKSYTKLEVLGASRARHHLKSAHGIKRLAQQMRNGSSQPSRREESSVVSRVDPSPKLGFLQ